MAKYDVDISEPKGSPRQAWPEELAARREEALSVVLRNFETAKQYLDEYPASEMLIRFQMGVVMSMSHEDNASDEAAREFEKVTRLADEVKKGTEPDGSRNARKILRAQAFHNLAVLHHRRLFGLIRKERSLNALYLPLGDSSPLKSELFREADRAYRHAEEEVEEFHCPILSMPPGLDNWIFRELKQCKAVQDSSWDAVAHATRMAAYVGRLLLEKLAINYPWSDKLDLQDQASSMAQEKSSVYEPQSESWLPKKAQWVREAGGYIVLGALGFLGGAAILAIFKYALLAACSLIVCLLLLCALGLAAYLTRRGNSNESHKSDVYDETKIIAEEMILALQEWQRVESEVSN